MIYFSNELIYHYFNDICPNSIEYLQNSSNFYEITYIFSGEAFLSTDNKIYKLSRRSIVVLPPKCKRRFFTEKDKKIKFFHIAFDKKILEGKFQYLDDFILKPFHPTNSSSLHLFFLAINSIERKNLDDKLFLNYLKNFIPLILLEIINSEIKPLPSSPSSSLVKDVASFINSKFTSNLSVESIADSFFVSRSYLSHEFKKHFNVSIKQYITRKRMLYARKLIKSGVKPTKVAGTCGYENYSTFFRTYKNYFGEAPENYNDD